MKRAVPIVVDAPSSLTDKEAAVYHLALGMLAYDEANPNVGMGLFPHVAVQDAMKRQGYTDKDVRVEVVGETVFKKWTKR